MTPNTRESAGKPAVDFEAALRTLVLDSFAEGATVEGTWELTSPSAVVPSWRVTIEKTDRAVLPDNESAFLDE